ncbi:MAG: glycerate kinase [Anaerolineae bacterium]
MEKIKIDPGLVRSGPGRERREQAVSILEAALGAADAAEAVRRHVSSEHGSLVIGHDTFKAGRGGNVYVVGAGKGSAAMARALEELLPGGIATGAVNVKRGYGVPTRVVRVTEAGHPVPDESAIEGTARIVELLAGLGESDLVLCVFSGGGSSLLTLPAPGISLSDLQGLTEVFLACGATIGEINTVRKHISQVKGGRLARLAAPASVVSLILSDVVGDPLDVVASGPTVPDETSFADAWAVLERRGILESVPASVQDHLLRGLQGKEEETPKPGDPLIDRVHNVTVGSNRLAAEAAVDRAKELGLHCLLLTTHLEGEAREVGRVLAALGRDVAQNGDPAPAPACLVLGGETTVTLRGPGRGGRNQEMALAAALAADGLPGVLIACFATDGTDGPTDAAGAVIEGDTVARARSLGLDPARHLAENDAYPLFHALGDLIVTGPTRTNVNDLALVIVS